jgi:hypothetical protein
MPPLPTRSSGRWNVRDTTTPSRNNLADRARMPPLEVQMKRLSTIVTMLVITAFSTAAFAEWKITNKDNSSYELTKQCGSNKKEDWSIAGGVTHSYSIPAGTTSCTITVKNNNSSCTVKDGESCTIQSGKISNG